MHKIEPPSELQAVSRYLLDPTLLNLSAQLRTKAFSAPRHQACLFVTRIYQKQKVCHSGIHLNYPILISSSFFIASQNDTTRQTDENWCSQRFCSTTFSKRGLTGYNSNRYDVDTNAYFLSGKALYPFIYPVSTLTLFVTILYLYSVVENLQSTIYK